MTAKSNVRVIRVGRSATRSDVVVQCPEKTISGVHIELHPDNLGRWLVIDRSRNGTFVYRNDSWRRLKQEHVAADEWLSLGRHIVSMKQLLEQVDSPTPPPVSDPAPTQIVKSAPRRKIMKRDPETGVIYEVYEDSVPNRR